ncbi:MAG TPA: LON peptidase substrate-binding domain-containing protein [Alphaproteobacteria bacterium]|nr:LON peptidase substrate-binding domain-containing protein [Alphaproteobacteria bacterium]
MPSTVRLPVLPLRDVVAFPLMTLPLLVGRPKSLKACAAALSGDGRLLLVAQREVVTEDPSAENLYEVGVIARLAQHLPLPESRMKLLVRGEQRARLVRLADEGVMADAQLISDPDGASTPVEPPDFSLTDWTADSAAVPVVDLQRLLEDETLSPAERLSAARALFGEG